VNAHVIVVREMQRNSGLQVFQLFAESVVSRVNRRMLIRMVKF
jgi:hypothetical protein